ncbi:calcium-binding protein [Microcoleus sp. OTE_8_concoct_300]|uniref:calcium-binding protein n=1 Tax=Microcoleus sp. OTE_8_concoct_300 TaxID=2964710 RepID=UPI00403F01B0
MANYAIFDEQYYLSQYPWVKPAIDAGSIKSGLEHFQKYGQAAGLTKISRYFDESTYLADNPEIAPFVRTVNPNAPFATGLDHFIQYGYEQGRSQVSPEYDEAFYVANNRDILPFIQNGTFKNGYQHFLQFGIKDGRFGTSFLESDYLQKNRDIVPFVNSGALKTGREHYFKFGSSDPSRSATFVGTSGNDIITGSGVGNAELIGVEIGVEPHYGARLYESDGSNEFDTLIGGIGRDKFVLGEYQDFARNVSLRGVQYYIGPGFATIRNFTKGQDSIQLLVDSSDQLLVFPINNNRDLAIQRKGYPTFENGVSVPSTSPFDTIGVIEGGGNLSLNLSPGSGFTRLLT